LSAQNSLARLIILQTFSEPIIAQVKRANIIVKLQFTESEKLNKFQSSSLLIAEPIIVSLFF
jgi:hypothetical protein